MEPIPHQLFAYNSGVKDNRFKNLTNIFTLIERHYGYETVSDWIWTCINDFNG